MATVVQNNLLKDKIDIVLLKSLSECDREGQEIVKEIEQKTSGQFKLKSPSLHSALRKLEEQGLVRSYIDENKVGKRTKERKMYALTDSGKDSFLKAMAEWEYQRTIADQLISNRAFNLSVLPPVAPKPKKPRPQSNANSGVPKFIQIDKPVLFDPNSIANAKAKSQAEQSAVIQNDIVNNQPSFEQNIAPINTPDQSVYDGFEFQNNSNSFENTLTENNTNDYVDFLNDNVGSFGSRFEQSELEQNEYSNEYSNSSFEQPSFEQEQYQTQNNDRHSALLQQAFASNEIIAASILEYKHIPIEEFDPTALDSNEDLFKNANNTYFDNLSEQTFSQYQVEQNNNLQEEIGQFDNNTQNFIDNNTQTNTENDSDMLQQNVLTNDYSNYVTVKKTPTNSMDETKQLLEREYRKFLSELIIEQPFATAQTNEQQQAQVVQAPIVQSDSNNALSNLNIQDFAGQPDNAMQFGPNLWQEQDMAVGTNASNEYPTTIAPNFETNQSYPKTTLFESPTISSTTTTMSNRKVAFAGESNDRYKKLANNVKVLGNDISVRQHNKTQVKEYNSKNYYFSNKLMYQHFAILFMIMVVEVAAVFVSLNLMIGITQSILPQILTYVGSLLIIACLPIYAAVSKHYAPEKRKRLNTSFSNTMIFRTVLFVQFTIITFVINMIFGMPLPMSKAFAVTTVLPVVLLTNLPLSAYIFKKLHASKKYSVE